MKDEVKIYDKLDKKIIKKFTISIIFTKTYYIKESSLLFLHYYLYYFTLFYITNNIKHLLFSTKSTKNILCPHFLYKNLVLYIAKILLNFIKLQKHY